METLFSIQRKTLVGFLREWGPYFLTALLVPGGIVITLAFLARRWKQRREAVGFRIAAQLPTQTCEGPA